MYHKSVLKNQIWWLILPLSFVFIFLLGIFTYLFYGFQKGHYEEDLYLYRDSILERIKDDYERKSTLGVLLSKALVSIDSHPNASIDELEDTLDLSWSLINETPLLTEDISFGFVLSAQGELFIAENGADGFVWQDDITLSSLVNPTVLASENADMTRHFYLSPIFEYSTAYGDQGDHVFLAKALFDETGHFLGSYGMAIFLPDWIRDLSELLNNVQAVMILDRTFSPLAISPALEEEIRVQPNLLDSLLKEFVISEEGVEGLLFNSVPFWTDYNFNLSFFPLEIEELRDPLYILVGFPAFTYANFAREMIIPLLLFSFVVFFLSFILVYSFMEIFIWKPLNILTTHIIDISSTGDFFVELPEGILVEEINYLFMQFKFFQKRLASLLFETKNLHGQSSSTQDIIFQKSSRIYFDSKEVVDRSGKLDSDNEFLNQFLDKFAGRYKDLFKLSEDVVSLLGRTVRWKEDMLSSWSSLFEIVGSLDVDAEPEQRELSINRLQEWVRTNGDSLRVIIKELSEIQNLLSEFSQSRLDLTNSFFDVRESLNFLMDTTRETINFLERLKGEVEELFLVQSQDLQKNRDRMKQLLKNI